LGTISAREARRIAIAATGLAKPRPPGRVDRRHLAGVVDRLGLLQLDSVNVVGRAHDLVLYSRLGPHPRRLLADAAYRRHELIEAWCHEASLVPASHWPLLGWRRTAMYAGRWWKGWGEAHQDALAAAEAQVAARGPLTAAQMEGPRESRGAWWGWDETKRALEFLFAVGRLGVADRTGATGFERSYDLIDRVVPAEILALPEPPEDEARKQLLQTAARAQGIATTYDLADHHRQSLTKVKALVLELAEEGALIPVAVEGWKDPAYLHPDAARPRRTSAAALVAPFDPIVWNRRRAERLFGFHYRIEIYTPAPKRIHGYYVLPFVWGDRLAGRVDVKADRKAGVLRAHGAFAEEHADPGEVAEPLAAELRRLAAFHGLADVEVGPRGDLAGPLAAAVRST
jgi:hypothetical protein